MIWEYRHSSQYSFGEFLHIPDQNIHNRYLKLMSQGFGSYEHYGYHPCCIFCGTNLKELALPANRKKQVRYYKDSLQACSACGWWVVNRGYEEWYGEPEPHHGCISACGTLVNLDLADISLPIHEVNAYLTARFEERARIHPRKLELIVSSIFKNIGYEVRTTSYSNDQGIDIFVLDGANESTIGIQVKRYRNAIEAEQIRSFAGALLLNRLTHGIFVTTGKYTSGATSTATAYSPRGLMIELWDAEQLYDALKINQQPMYTSGDDPSTPFYDLCMDLSVLKS